MFASKGRPKESKTTMSESSDVPETPMREKDQLPRSDVVCVLVELDETFFVVASDVGPIGDSAAGTFSSPHP